MILHVQPTDSLKGKLRLPASKSYSIRAFMIAACGGQSKIVRPSQCDDAKVALKVAQALGAYIQKKNSKSFHVIASRLKTRPDTIDVKESGTVLRFLLPLMCALNRKARIIGERTLVGRPNLFLNQTLRQMGMKIRGHGKQESVPITIKGGMLRGGKVKIDGSLSSQFISALLIACPLLHEDTQLTLTGKSLVSTDYILMTRQVLKKSGILIQQRDNRNYFIKGQQVFKGLKRFVVPSDYGLAAFLLGACAFVKSNVTLVGHLEDTFIQADQAILPFLRRMGVRFRKDRTSIRIKGPYRLGNGNFSLKNCPDLLPIMAVMALFGHGRTRLYDIGHARVKESDRISDLRKELMKVGAMIKEKQNEMIIYPQSTYKNNCLLNPHKDHRLAMAFSVLGLKVGVRVKDIECVSKSYPEFVRDLKFLGANVILN